MSLIKCDIEVTSSQFIVRWDRNETKLRYYKERVISHLPSIAAASRVYVVFTQPISISIWIPETSGL